MMCRDVGLDNMHCEMDDEMALLHGQKTILCLAAVHHLQLLCKGSSREMVFLTSTLRNDLRDKDGEKTHA